MNKKLNTKLMSLLTLLSVIFIATACSKTDTTSQSVSPATTEATTTTETATTAEEVTTTEEITTTPTPETADTVEESEETTSEIQDAIDKASEAEITAVTDSLEGVADYLKKNNLVSGDQTEVAAEMIGALSGFKYLDSNVEVYEYDIASDVYKDLVKTNTVALESFDMTLNVSAVNGKYVLFCEDASNKDDIIKAFKDMK